ncbi:LysM-like peptidoglycan-binding domain-containing protein [Providencia manganoxydans]|uniref:LysM-like peptidoglycan-binding domain-containing protein n=1 Tax=Providencia manganoxydans TaxID=2923283 RepID=UPI0032DA32B9
MFKLSVFHRIGIAILAIIIIAALFWPTGEKNTESQITQNQPQPIVVPPPTTPEIITSTPEEPFSNGDSDQPQIGLPTEPEIVQEPPEDPAPVDTTPPATTTPPKQTQQPTTASQPSANEWRNYQIQKGKTLAQLFRDNNLQANDAFVMARAEGAEKPLSNLHKGQKVRLKANAKGEVEVLEITTPDGKTFSFARLSDGSYYRTP